ncbi:MAG: RnfH family protein [SAR86 cluster bacterium]|uniref:UPF0125 protein HQ497_06545 n=1 Tax=SAR86 cluster bacterium TaxID=2030880 RepID=A0A972VWR6_9GAMM|nr:RnfH family protein [SAR86 cluster bacterium]
MTDRLVIEVVYITPDAERVVSVELAADAVVEDAIVACGILQAAPELDLETLQIGIYGRLVSLSTKLEAEERVEIYRPLVLDPMAARRQRAQSTVQQRPGRRARQARNAALNNLDNG